MNTEFELELENIKTEKIKEAKLLFKTIGITQEAEDEQFLSEIPTYSENSNPEKKKIEFHWTRLSINSNSSNIIE